MHLTKIAIMLAQLGVSGIYFDALLKREERTIKRDSKIDLYLYQLYQLSNKLVQHVRVQYIG